MPTTPSVTSPAPSPVLPPHEPTHSGFRLLAVHAHPDDESSKGAAATALYVASGATVRVVSCTGGERGDILNPRLQHDVHILRDLAQVRRDEMRAAQQILGVEHTWLGFVDSGLPEGDPKPPLPEGCFGLEPVAVPAEALTRVIRELRPHVVTTYDENGGYPHPDHIMTHLVTVAAFRAAGDPDAFPHAGTPWQPLKLYYNQLHTRRRVEEFHKALVSRGLESPYEEWLKGWRPERDRQVTTQVPASDYFETRDNALLAHATQVDPEGNWFRVDRSVQAEIWPTEDYELAISYVPTQQHEDDLFAGLGSAAEADELAVEDVGRPPLLDRVVPGLRPDGTRRDAHASSDEDIAEVRSA